MGSIMPAVWSFNLALRARGLGTVLTTLHLDYAKDVSDLLGIPDNVLQVGLLPVAYTVGTEFKLAKRVPLKNIVHFDTW
jgi:nitroreductase